MKGYKSYKESGIEWIGKVPEDWDVIKLKRLTPIKRGASPRPIDDLKYFDENGEFSWVRIADVSASERYLENTKEKLSELGASLSVKQYPGDFFLSIAGSVGKPIITKIKCCIHDGFVWFPELKINPEYLYYIFQTGLPFIGLGKIGTQLNLNTETIGNIVIPNLSNEDIQKIVSFLDYKTNLINAAIEKKKRLIELLKEKRQAVINEAVTKGLNPNVPMKDSGVKWLGEIPVDWKVKKVKHLLNDENGIKIGPFGSALKLDTLSDKGIKVYGQGNVIKDDFNHGHRYIDIERFEKDFKQYEILNGDILITMMGTTGKSKVFNSSYEKGILDSHLLRLRFNENLFDGRLFSILLEQSDYVYQQLAINSVGSIMAGLNSSIVKELSIITPTLEIQKEILNYIDENSKIIDSISSKILFQIEKLQTYRQSLISEAVTGKIDVRDWEITKN